MRAAKRRRGGRGWEWQGQAGAGGAQVGKDQGGWSGEPQGGVPRGGMMREGGWLQSCLQGPVDSPAPLSILCPAAHRSNKPSPFTLFPFLCAPPLLPFSCLALAPPP